MVGFIVSKLSGLFGRHHLRDGLQRGLTTFVVPHTVQKPWFVKDIDLCLKGNFARELATCSDVMRFLEFLTSNKKLLGAPGLTTRSKDATRGSWHR